MGQHQPEDLLTPAIHENPEYGASRHFRAGWLSFGIGDFAIAESSSPSFGRLEGSKMTREAAVGTRVAMLVPTGGT